MEPPVDPRADPNLIRAYDKYGQEVFITKADWRANVLPGAIQAEWDNPDQLYGVILGALNDGFRADIVDAASRLYAIDQHPVRGACIWGIVLMEEGRLDEAENVFQDFISKHGEEGVILTNLAKVHASRKNDAQSEKILWRGLEVDPNQDNAVGWYEVIHRKRGGAEAGLKALRRIAALPGSWRAQLWLARAALQSENVEPALALYDECLSRAGTPAPGDLLMQMSGDLGNAGRLQDILRLVGPRFDPLMHGLSVGNNLIKANLDLGRIGDAREILNRLYSFNRLDWKESLSEWDTIIAKAGVAAAPVDARSELKVTLLAGEGPIWLKPDSPAIVLYPAKPVGAAVVQFLGSSAEVAGPDRPQLQLADAPGRMSRALPLFLAEQLELGSRARSMTLVPWIAAPTAGFVLSGAAWRDEDAINYARQAGVKAEFVVISHLRTRSEPCSAQVRLVRVSDGRCLGELDEAFSFASPADGILKLTRRLSELLAREAGIESLPYPPAYAVPPDLSSYLLRLEQLLAVRCAAIDGVRPGFLNGEREILDGNLQQCLSAPAGVNARLLLAQTMLAMKRVRPDILPEYKERLALLQQEHPLSEPARSVVQRLFDEAFATPGRS